MPIVRVYEMADGSLRILVPSTTTGPQAASETEAQFIARKAAGAEAGDPSLAAAVRHLDVDRATLPTDRSKRFAWRLNPLGSAVVVDPTVPAPIDPRKAAQDAKIDALVGFTAQQKAALKTLFN